MQRRWFEFLRIPISVLLFVVGTADALSADDGWIFSTLAVKQDHFADNQENYSIRYEFFVGASEKIPKAILLNVGGLSESYEDYDEQMTLLAEIATQVEGIAVLVEHRFTGYSPPLSGLEDPSFKDARMLKKVEMDQVIQDQLKAVETLKKTYSIGKEAPVRLKPQLICLNVI